MPDSTPLTIKIEDDELVIRIGVDTLLTSALHYNPNFNQVPIVTNRDVFIKDILSELHRDEEDGTTLVTYMFDCAALMAVESGCEGIELPEPVDY